MYTQEAHGETPLHLVTRYYKTETARQMIEYGADVNARDKTGRSPLQVAIASTSDGVFQLLLRNRACQFDLQAFDGCTALMDACRLGANLMVEDLVSAGAKVLL